MIFNEKWIEHENVRTSKFWKTPSIYLYTSEILIFYYSCRFVVHKKKKFICTSLLKSIEMLADHQFISLNHHIWVFVLIEQEITKVIALANQYATVIRPWDSEFYSENEICIKLHSLFFKWRKKNFKTCNTFFLYFKQICKTKIFFGYILFVTQTLCYHYHYELLKMKVKLRKNQKKKLSITTFIINSSFIL